MTPEIEMIGIVKRFGDLAANDHIHLEIEKGEIRALVGENGAGKTTLMRILFGIYHPDKGIIKIKGKEVRFSNPGDAISHKIGMVHQHFMLFEDLSVSENIIFGMEPRRLGFVDQKKAHIEVEKLAQSYGFNIKVDASLASLSVGEKQRVEILKTLYRGADVIILDEPTAVLTPQERGELFNVLRNLSQQGKTIILITHKLVEVMELSHKATVLRRGKLVGTVETAASSVDELARMMVGREIFLTVDKPPAAAGKTVLKVQDLTVIGEHRLRVLDQVSFDVCAGEIVGLAGVAGNGQSELVDALMGFLQASSGSILLNTVDITQCSTARRRELGFAYIPEDRYRRGLAVTQSVTDNLIMGFQMLPPISRRGVFQKSMVKKWSQARLEEYDVRLASPDEAAGSLSGGNLQKVILAREFSRQANFILADQPTRGVDIGATEFIYGELVKRRDMGAGILFISADLNEVMSLSDRILVMYGGRIVASIPAEKAEEHELGLLMAGTRVQAG